MFVSKFCSSFVAAPKATTRGEETSAQAFYAPTLATDEDLAERQTQSKRRSPMPRGPDVRALRTPGV